MSRAEFGTHKAGASRWPYGDIAAFAADFLAYASKGRTDLSDVAQTHIRLPAHQPFRWPRSRHGLRASSLLARPRRSYEETATLLMGFLIDRFRPQVFFDVGAAYGYFALVAASRIDSPPTVHAFEMRPDRHEQVKETLVHHNYQDRAFAHLVGLSDVHKGAVDIWFSGHRLFERKPSIDEAEGPWWMRLKFLFHSLTGRKPSRKLTGARVPVTTIDHFCAEHDIEPDLIKIDVDGYEGKVLRGASETLARNRPLVLLELHREKLMPAGETRQGAVAVLLSQGYKACLFTDHKDLDNCRILPIELGEPLLLRQQTSHILFVPRA